MDIDRLRRQLSDKGLFEVSHVERFEAWRTLPDGRTSKVVIEVSDMGSDRPQVRYSCSVHAEDGELLVSGNPDDDPETTITFVHWNELDNKLADWMNRNP